MQILVVQVCILGIGLGLIYILKRRFYLFYTAIKKQIYIMLTVKLISELLFSLFTIAMIIKPFFMDIK